jgi:beta-alanine--pyruvate transaminase
MKPFMAADAPPYAVDLLQGYTNSGHPPAAAVGHAVLDLRVGDGLIQRMRSLEAILKDVVHSLNGEVGVLDVRNRGLAAGPQRRP